MEDWGIFWGIVHYTWKIPKQHIVEANNDSANQYRGELTRKVTQREP